jgi:hypothetical protein
LKTLFSEAFVPEAVFTEFMVKASDTEDEKRFTKIKTAKVRFHCRNDPPS